MIDESTIDREVVQPIVDRNVRLGGDGESLLAESGLIETSDSGECNERIPFGQIAFR